MGIDWPFDKQPVEFYVEAGLSNRGQDLDNVIKPVLDTYQSIYEGFNDNKVYRITMQKVITPKNAEYLLVRVNETEEQVAEAAPTEEIYKL